MESIKPNDLVYTMFGYGVVTDMTNGNDDLPLPGELSLYRGESKMEKDEPEKEDQLDNEQIVEVEFKWGGKGYVQVKDLQKNINVKVKTFIGERKTFDLQVPITSTMDHLYNLIVKEIGPEAKNTSNPRFYYPMGFIKSLAGGQKNLSEFDIPNGAKLIMMAKKAFHWGLDRKPESLELSNDNMTLKVVENKTEGGRAGNAATILGNTPMSSGKNYWTIKLDELSANDDSITVGICYEDLNRTQIPMKSGLYWGYQPIICQKFSPENSDSYGNSCRKGDSIGVCLEFSNDSATLSFYKNGIFMGIAERNLVGTFYPAVTFFANGSTITLDHSAPTPFN